jgi:hypothetical protein
MNGQSWNILNDDLDEKSLNIEVPSPSFNEKQSEIPLVDTPRTAKRKMSSPMKMLRKLLTTEKDDDIDYEIYGNLCFQFPKQHSPFSSDDIKFYGRVDRYKRPDDIKAALILAAQRGHLDFFKHCESLGGDIISEELIVDLINTSSQHKNENIAEHLRSTYGKESINEAKLPSPIKAVL